MKCKWNECKNEARPRSPYCSGTCKKRAQRASGTNVPVKVGQAQSGTQVGQEVLEPLLDRAKQFNPLMVFGSAYIKSDKPPNFGLDDCECQHCQTNRTNGSKHVINHFPRLTAAELCKPEHKGVLNRVSLPGDVDYKGTAVGSCTPPQTTQGVAV